ncbi:hypothetical protein QAD02_006154 [Eretmocerus hayati]|uniref:Uncharacterized protein n=1 Tax=Eretmocerus hayati TaxID=131215 RepID=A0ACC2N0G8_9HYME|nr:hypothetical protein QAD02_006154 [Eretmocerus hayati]
MRYHVNYHLVQIARNVDQIKAVYNGVEQLKQQFATCPPANEQMQKLLRLLHEVLLSCKQGEQAAAVMVELLATYTFENASAAREDAQRCILAALADLNKILLDPLLALKPVRFLEGELIHDLLLIFVKEKLPVYLKFHSEYKEFVESNLGLNHEQNMKRTRLLTFMQLAETNPEMSFSTIQSELKIKEVQVESFIIHGVLVTHCNDKDASIDSDPKIYVNAILEVHKKYNALVLVAFNNDSGFVTALDKACGRFINANSVTKAANSSSKSPELLAKYCDVLLKKSSKNPEEAELEDTLNQGMVVFKYIEDKDVYQKFYSKMLAK